MSEILAIPQFQNNHLSDVSPVSEYALYHNGRLKVYPDGGAEFLCADRSIFREAGFELCGSNGEEHTDKDKVASDAAASLERSKRRARSMVADYIRTNDLDLFVTFTLDKRKVNRYDDDEVFRKLHNWLDNSVRRKGLKYVLVAEYHKKERALHFHACINRCFTLTDSGTLSLHDGKKPKRPRSEAQRKAWLEAGASIVYNVDDWPLGFSTAIEMYGDRARAIAYVCKYISKSDCKIGGRWYYSGGDLRLPVVYTCDVNYNAVAASLQQQRSHGGSWHIDALECNASKVMLKGGEIVEYFETVEH